MDTQDFLTQRGHEVISSRRIVGVVQGIAVDKEGNVKAYADYRKSGEAGHAVIVERTWMYVIAFHEKLMCVTTTHSCIVCPTLVFTKF